MLKVVGCRILLKEHFVKAISIPSLLLVSVLFSNPSERQDACVYAYPSIAGHSTLQKEQYPLQMICPIKQLLSNGTVLNGVIVLGIKVAGLLLMTMIRV